MDGVACGVALGGGGVDRGAALRGQRRLGVPLCVDSIAYGGRSGGQRRSGGGVALRRMASLGEPLCGDGVARGVVVRRGVAVGGAQGWAYRVGFAPPGGFRAIRRPEGIACGIDAWGYA